jgi:DNA-binding FrmR family transcriptional regulator
MDSVLYSKEIRNRLSKNIGHLSKVREMIDGGEPFDRVMLQLSAVRKSLTSTSNALVAEQAQEELLAALQSEGPERIKNFYNDYAKFF